MFVSSHKNNERISLFLSIGISVKVQFQTPMMTSAHVVSQHYRQQPFPDYPRRTIRQHRRSTWLQFTTQEVKEGQIWERGEKECKIPKQ